MLVGHMGGPFWARKDERAWSVPKGEPEPGEDPVTTAQREFREETGITPPPPPYRDLGTVRQRSGKVVRLFAVEADVDVAAFQPGTFPMTLRGRSFEVPEIDRLRWVGIVEARRLLVAGQVPFLDRLDPAPTADGSDGSGSGSGSGSDSDSDSDDSNGSDSDGSDPGSPA